MAGKEIIDTLYADVHRLMELHSEAVKQAEELRATNARQAAKIRSLQEQAKRDKEELARLEMAAALNGSGRDKSAARAQVNRLLREVDKCIALVSDRI